MLPAFGLQESQATLLVLTKHQSSLFSLMTIQRISPITKYHSNSRLQHDSETKSKRPTQRDARMTRVPQLTEVDSFPYISSGR